MADRDLQMTIIMETTDAPRAAVVHSLLESSGIHATKSEIAAGLVGWMPQFVLRVPAADLEHARALISAMDAETPVDDDDEGDEDAPDLRAAAREEAPSSVDYRTAARGAPEARKLPPRLKRTAAFAALALPFGGGHMYVHDYRSALIIAGMEVLSVVAANAWGIPLVGLGLPLMIAADLAGATWACDAREKGAAAPHRWRRFAVSAATLAVLVWIPVGYWPVSSLLAGVDGRALCEYAEDCRTADYRSCLLDVAAQRGSGRGPTDGCAECVGSLETCRVDLYAECPACFGLPPE